MCEDLYPCANCGGPTNQTAIALAGERYAVTLCRACVLTSNYDKLRRRLMREAETHPRRGIPGGRLLLDCDRRLHPYDELWLDGHNAHYHLRGPREHEDTGFVLGDLRPHVLVVRSANYSTRGTCYVVHAVPWAINGLPSDPFRRPSLEYPWLGDLEMLIGTVLRINQTIAATDEEDERRRLAAEPKIRVQQGFFSSEIPLSEAKRRGLKVTGGIAVLTSSSIPNAVDV